MRSDILVVGATGGVGQHVVRKLIARGQAPRCVVRDMNHAEDLFDGQVEFHIGDIREPDTLPEAFADIRVVICATGSRMPFGNNGPQHVDFEGIANLTLAALAAQVEHFILVSSVAVTRAENNPLNNFGNVLEWKLRGEDSLRSSGLAYTIVRPGGLRDDPGGEFRIEFDQGDTISGLITREDVAEVCLQALAYPEAYNATFEVVQTDEPGPNDWKALFSTLEPD